MASTAHPPTDPPSRDRAKRRTTPLRYIDPHAHRDPSWFYNVRAHPHHVRLGGQRFRAEIVDNHAERARLWELADMVFPGFAIYRESAARAGRTIPIVQLVPHEAG